MAIIAVFNPKDGVGTTATALDLLAAIARRGERPLAIDLDPECRLSQHFGACPRDAAETLCGFFVHRTPLDDIAQITRSGVVLCPAHPDLATMDALLGKSLDAVTRLRKGLRRPGATVGPVVIDCGAALNVLALNAIFACDLMLVPVAGDPLSLEGAREVERALDALLPVLGRRLPHRRVRVRVDAADLGWLHDGLKRMALVSADSYPVCVPLAGGVSSDIYRVDLPGTSFCVKRALPKLKVAADWQAPVERNRWEVEWMRVAAGIVPQAVPAILGEDRATGCFAMAWLPPDSHPVWKTLLRDGDIEIAFAARVGDTLGRIHAATADRDDIAARFRTDDIFHAIRLEPYLVATARAHPDLASRLAALVDTTAGTHRVLVHGDFSPKNILRGAEGPVILDAECAWYGDPAFDLAFVLNHLLLKGLWRPAWRSRYLDAFGALADAYLGRVDWEPPAVMAARTAALLPGLMLGRVDGKSPAEYLTADADRDEVRAFAGALLLRPVADLDTIVRRWRKDASP